MDLDGDGKLDILTGCWPGELYFFKGLGQGKFAKAETLKDSNGKQFKLGSASTVFAADWNGDGKLDLLIGDQPGHVHLMLNEGSVREYAFKTSQKLKVDGTEIKVGGGDSGPIAVDWDGDKKLDLIVGCGDGSVLFYKNTGTEKEPKLAAAETLVSGVKGYDPENTELKRGSRAKVCVFDWNGDGKPDLLLGDFAMFKVAKEMSAEERKALEAAKSKLAELRKEYQEVVKEWQPLANPPRKQESEEERTTREQKFKSGQDKAKEQLQSINKALEEPLKRQSDLLRKRQDGNLTEAEQKELTELQEKVQKRYAEYREFYQKEVQLFSQPPADETPEQQKVRESKLKEVQEKATKLSTAMLEPGKVIRQFEAPQYVGSVWLFVRK